MNTLMLANEQLLDFLRGDDDAQYKYLMDAVREFAGGNKATALEMLLDIVKLLEEQP